LSCGSPEEITDEGLTGSPQELRGANSRLALSYRFASFEAPPAGVAGGKDVVFVGSPFEGRVVALGRHSRTEIGNLPTPPEGFVLPYILRSLDEGRVAVLDAGGFPSPLPFVPANPRIYEYDYHFAASGGFSANLARTVSFENELIGFAEDIAPLGHGRYILSDAVLGALWVVERDGTVRPGIAPRSNSAGDAIFPLAFCPTMPQITVGGIPFLFTGSTLPGVAALAVNDNTLYFYSPCGRGLYSVPVSSLFDHREPYRRAADIRLVSPAPSSVAVEQLLGLAFNRYVPNDPYLYAADSLQLRIIRINVKNGARQVVADDPTLFNFPSSANFLPPVRGISPLLVVSNQQHRTALTNDAITADIFQPPFLATEVIIR
jgi:hypothetical protein